MHTKHFRRLLILFLPFFLSSFLFAQAPAARTGVVHHPRSAAPRVCAECIRAHEDFLASDALNGRGSATHDELVAATYIASELEQYGVAPLGDDDGYLQKVALEKKKPASPPELSFTPPGGGPVTWKHGAEFVVLENEKTEASGPLQKLQSGTAIEKGAFVLLALHGAARVSEDQIKKATDGGAAAILLPATARYKAHWEAIGQRLLKGTIELPGEPSAMEGGATPVLMLSDDAAALLAKLADGTVLHFSAPMSAAETVETWNVLAVIRGSDPALEKKAVLFSAHLDHLGVGAAVKGDSIYNGADDDASGVTAVLELARVLGAGRKPRRTVLFALFGSEELGGLGAQYFRAHPPVPLAEIAANLEFEMIGRPDAAVKPDELWLTGWERSNLGPVLAEHGAKLVGDPHPEQHFFMRSDNYELALKGVVAQTISSYGLHSDYHQPSDEVSRLDFPHMDSAIGSLLGPVEWLVNSSFAPEWKPGGKP
jgi:aminopeptidase YwaD